MIFNATISDHLDNRYKHAFFKLLIPSVFRYVAHIGGASLVRGNHESRHRGKPLYLVFTPVRLASVQMTKHTEGSRGIYGQADGGKGAGVLTCNVLQRDLSRYQGGIDDNTHRGKT